MKRTAAFTLVELLVVIAIIVALLSILMPSMGKAMSAAQTAVCLSQERQIHTAVTSYLATNMTLFPPRRNWGRWYANVADRTPIDPMNTSAYWGAAYAKEVGFEAAREVFHCPEALTSDMNTGSSNPGLGYTDGSYEDGHIYNTYGFNGLTDSAAVSRGASKGSPYFEDALSGDPGRKLSQVRHPASVIMFQDAFEHMLDGNGDMPWSFTQWSGGQNREYFRHNGDTAGNVLWGDGHGETVSVDADWTVWLYAAY